MVSTRHGLSEVAAVLAHIQVENVVVDESQSHLASELCRQRCDLTGAMVSLVIEVIFAVQFGAVVSVGLGLLFRNTEAELQFHFVSKLGGFMRFA